MSSSAAGFPQAVFKIPMPRPYNGGTYNQTRTFTWSGTDLASETTPEAGQVQYQYDGAHRVTQRTNAAGQQTQYSYDPYGRLTEVRRYTPGQFGTLMEQVNQRVDYYYDVNPFDTTGFSQNTWGRLAASAWHNEQPNSPETFNYQYSYNTAGRVLKQRLNVQPAIDPGFGTTSTTTATIATSGYPLQFTVGSGLAYQPGLRVRIISAYSPNNYMEGNCYAYSGTSLSVTVDTVVGSGAFSAWIINIPQNLIAINLDATYAWDNEGRMTSLGYPADQNGNAGSTDTYTYDAMGRLSSMGATWNPDGTLATFNGQTRSYNSLGQLTQITGQMFNGQNYFTAINMQYNYVAGQNNGRISSTVDGVTGETVNYTYDSLNRLATAASTNGAWGNAYTYDGWGNLTAKTITQGTAPTYSANPDPSRNGGPDPTVVDPQLDVEGRPITISPSYSTPPAWTYDPAGKMVFYLSGQGNTTTDRTGSTTTSEACEFRFYGITGQRLGRYTCSYSSWNGNPNQFNYTKVEEEHKTAGILTGWGGKAVTTDRLGSIRADGSGGTYSYYPYGEVKTAPSGQTGLYADLEDPVRVYDSNGARFTRPDPSYLNVDLTNPVSWNRFAYVNGDPINFNDPSGLLASICDLYPLLPRCPGVPGGGGPPSGQRTCTLIAGDPCSGGSGGGGPEPDPTSPHQTLFAAFGKISSALSDAAKGGNLSVSVVDCWAGMESAFDPNAVTGTHLGLFQLNQQAWNQSGIGVPFNKANAFDAATNATAAVDYLGWILTNYVVGSSAYNSGDFSLDDVAIALTDYRWGPNSKKKSATYANKIMDCAKALDAGNWDAAMTALGK